MLVFGVSLFLLAIYAKPLTDHDQMDRTETLGEEVSLGPAYQIAPAYLTGVVGKTVDELLEMKTIKLYNVAGHCKWVGTSPVCDGQCEPGFQFIREYWGECKGPNDTEARPGRHCDLDLKFGRSCLFTTTKALCCRTDPIDCTWSGRWFSTKVPRAAGNFSYDQQCQFDYGNVTSSRCGTVKCKAFEPANFELVLTGPKCDVVKWGDLIGNAICGLIFWINSTGDISERWYKTGY